jgi:6-phosphogluconolactonase (cycloisomerase 2 family)
MKKLAIIFILMIASTGYCATIAEQLTAINDAKAAINAAIEAKGVTVDDAPLADYAGLIASISVGGTQINATETLVATLSNDIEAGDPVYVTSASVFKTAVPDTVPSGITLRTPAMSADGMYLAIPHGGTTDAPKLITYKWDSVDARYEATANPDAVPSGGAQGAAMSADGMYLAVTHSGAAAPGAPAYLITYKWNGANNRYEQTAAPNIAPSGTGSEMAMSADGMYLAVTHFGTAGIPRLITYKWSEANNRYQATAAPDTDPGSNCSAVAMSPDGSYLVIGKSGTPNLICYTWVSGNNRYESTTAPDTLPLDTVYALAISSDASTLVAAGVTSVYNNLSTYKWDSADGRYEITSTPETAPISDSYQGALLSSDGTYLVLSMTSRTGAINAFVCKWVNANNRYERHSNFDINPSASLGATTFIAGSSDLSYIAITGGGSSDTRLFTYKQDISKIQYSVYKANNPSVYDYTIAGFGYATESGIAGDQIDVRMLWWHNFMEGDFTP